jgi:hypothetical protein
MDACHSGEVDKSRIQVTTSPVISKNTKGTIKTYTYPVEVSEEYYQVGIKTSFELMQELFANVSKGSGAVVISAAAGNSYALESDEWPQWSVYLCIVERTEIKGGRYQSKWRSYRYGIEGLCQQGGGAPYPRGSKANLTKRKS